MQFPLVFLYTYLLAATVKALDAWALCLTRSCFLVQPKAKGEKKESPTQLPRKAPNLLDSLLVAAAAAAAAAAASPNVVDRGNLIREPTRPHRFDQLLIEALTFLLISSSISSGGIRGLLAVDGGAAGGGRADGGAVQGFQLLMDQRSGLITFQSLKRNAAALGLGQLGDEELMGMVREGDVDGDGALDQMEFCVLMLRLSPQLMDDYSQKLLLGEAFPADDHHYHI
uniref:EF-hand domain-containing protein n=1 Tax=Ananas comosus var. bracteatus TaxID=296719 RepID=A0A6V7NXD2_ANACO|nr:unnamed protein product [Ananas comosus var. bracteatus]